jgi:hypothetical protein
MTASQIFKIIMFLTLQLIGMGTFIISLMAFDENFLSILLGIAGWIVIVFCSPELYINKILYKEPTIIEESPLKKIEGIDKLGFFKYFVVGGLIILLIITLIVGYHAYMRWTPLWFRTSFSKINIFLSRWVWVGFLSFITGRYFYQIWQIKKGSYYRMNEIKEQNTKTKITH